MSSPGRSTAARRVLERNRDMSDDADRRLVKVAVVIMMPNDASRRVGRPAAAAAGGPGGPGRAAGDAAKIIGVRILAQKYW